jgi:hypothetical protein
LQLIAGQTKITSFFRKPKNKKPKIKSQNKKSISKNQSQNPKTKSENEF